MPIELSQALTAHDVDSARRGLDELRPLVARVQPQSGTVVVKTDAGTVTLEADMLLSMFKIVEAVSGSPQAHGVSDADEEVSPQEAAALLRMSRPSVMRLIDRGHLGARMVGSHHRLSRAEVLAYKEKQNRTRRKGLTEMARLSEEYDF